MPLSAQLHMLYLAFYSGEAYRLAAHLWAGLGLRYLLVLSAIAAFVPYALTVKVYERFLEAEAEYIASQWPEVVVQDGVLGADISQPHRIRNKAGETVIVIDTRAEKAAGMGSEPVYVTRDGIWVRIYGMTHPEFTALEGIATVIDGDALLETMHGVLTWLNWSYPLIILALFFWRMVQALLFGALGKVIASLMGSGLDYTRCVRIAVAAMTPAMLIDAALAYFGLLIPGWPLMTFVITAAYLTYGVKMAGSLRLGEESES